MSFYGEIILEGCARTESSQALKEQFDSYCDWCWGHGYGDCVICKKQFNKIYVPLRKNERIKELGLAEKMKGEQI